VIVESAPHDRKRLLRSMAKPIDPAMKAKKPICGEKPPSRAVAICSGIAIAASVRPAIRSPGKSLGWKEASERKIGQEALGFAEPFWAIDRSNPPRKLLSSGDIPISPGQKPAASLVRWPGFGLFRARFRVG